MGFAIPLQGLSRAGTGRTAPAFGTSCSQTSPLEAGEQRQSCASCSDPPPELLLLHGSLPWPLPASLCPRRELSSVPAEPSCSLSPLFISCLLSRAQKRNGNAIQCTSGQLQEQHFHPQDGRNHLAGATADCTTRSRARRRLEKKEIPKILVKLLWNFYFFSEISRGDAPPRHWHNPHSPSTFGAAAFQLPAGSSHSMQGPWMSGITPEADSGIFLSCGFHSNSL